jgi:hypothetical protein
MEITFLRNLRLPAGTGFSLGHSLHACKPELRLGLEETPGLPPAEFLMDATALPSTRHKEWDNLSMVSLLAQPLSGTELEISAGAAAGTLNESMGCFRLRNEDVPGRLYMRGWQRSATEFALDFMLCPDQLRFKAGETLEIEFSLYSVIENGRKNEPDDSSTAS